MPEPIVIATWPFGKLAAETALKALDDATGDERARTGASVRGLGALLAWSRSSSPTSFVGGRSSGGGAPRASAVLLCAE
jgi:hypothetical protein